MLNEDAAETKTLRSFKKLLAVPHIVERKTQRPFSDGWFAQLLNRQIELHKQLSPYLLQLILEDLETRGFLKEDQIKSWKSYEPKELRRRKLANNRKRTRFDLSLPVELKWVKQVLTKFSEKNGNLNQANYVWNLLVKKELGALVKAKYPDDVKLRKEKHILWLGEWEAHCSEFRRVGFDFSQGKVTRIGKQEKAPVLPNAA